MNEKPSPSKDRAQGSSERRASWLYAWLLFSAFITVPWMVLGMPRQVQQTFSDSSMPTWSPDGRFIAFVSDRTGNFDVYVMNADGTGIRDLTQSPAAEYGPAWSPDGQWIAFSSGREGNHEIYVMKPDATGLRRLTNNPGWDSDPAWSPDSRLIAFSSYRDANDEVYAMKPDSTDQRNLTSSPKFIHDNEPAWSPDGRSIAFTSTRDGNSEIYVMDSDGAHQRNLTSNSADDESPSWLPNGREIAFTSNRDRVTGIYVMNADGTDQRKLTNWPNDASEPAWSPDGRRIVFSSNRDRGTNVYVMNTDGSDVRKLTESVLTPPEIPTIDYFLAALRPSVIHIVLLLGLLSSNLFVMRHTQQALVLAGLRTLSAAVIMGLWRGEAWALWFFANGSLWLFTSLWGRSQIKRGECWLMRLHGEGSMLPRSWAKAPPEVSRQAAPSGKSVQRGPLPPFKAPTDPQTAFDQGKIFLAEERRAQAVACFMSAFRNGSPLLRDQAVAELEKLDEVETA